jgi:tetratricopeptide (TPR) repeat protein
MGAAYRSGTWSRLEYLVRPERRAYVPAMREGRGAPWPWLLAGFGVLVYWRVFHTFFTQDDFGWLWQATQQPPSSPLTPRYLGTILYFQVFWKLFGFRPWLFHAFNLALHVTTGLLFYRLLRTRVPGAWAAGAAAIFLSSPALFAALHWVSAASDLLCGAFLALAVWLLATGKGEWRRWAAVVSYALALSSKEIAVGAGPLLAALALRRGEEQARSGARPLLAAPAWRRGEEQARSGAGPIPRRNAGAWLAAASFLVLAAVGVMIALSPTAVSAGLAYAVRAGALLFNLPAYLVAALAGGLAYSVASDLAWARAQAVLVAGWVTLVLWIVWLLLRRSAAAWWAFFWFVAVLGPVTLLDRQFYFYYLYCALPGLLASIVLLLHSSSLRSGRVVPLLAALIALAQGVAVEARTRSRLKTAPLPSDFVLRRSLTARNALTDLAAHASALQPKLVMVGQQPVETAVGGKTTTETPYFRDPFWEANVRASLADGLAIRLQHPVVQEVEFVRWLEASDSAAAIAPYQIDGHLSVVDYPSYAGTRGSPSAGDLAGRLARAAQLIERRLFPEAREELEAVRRMAPEHPDVLLNLGALNAKLGDTAAAIASLRNALERAPQDVEALFNLGLLYWRQGRSEEAREIWSRLVAEAPESDLARAARDIMSGKPR